MNKKIVFALVIPLLAFVTYNLFQPRRNGCVLERVHSLTLDTVSYGEFIESIPIFATLDIDSVSTTPVLRSQVDELYFDRTSQGMTASFYLEYGQCIAAVTSKDTLVRDGRFGIRLSVHDTLYSALDKQKGLRMRLYLTDPTDAIKLPVGGFYKDSGGNYVYVVVNEKTVVRRTTSLGRKNSDFFEVLGGLTPGEVVITSSYENLPDKDTLLFQEIVESYKRIP